MSKRDYIIAVCLFILTATTAVLAWPEATTHLSRTEATASTKQLVVATDYFAPVTLEAKAAYVYDLSSGKALYQKNASVPLALASLTKIMTTVTAKELAPEDAEVVVDDKSLRQEGDSGLYANEQWSLNTLLQYTLVASSNDGAMAVASALGSYVKSTATSTEAAFVEAMNDKARTLGLSSMHFENPSGLDINEAQAGAYGSARDVAMLLAYAVQHHADIMEPTRYPNYTVVSDSNFKHTAENTDILTNDIPGLIAGKTGFTDLAGGNLAIVYDAGIGHPIVIVVLGSTYDGRFNDMQKLVRATLRTITQQ